MFINVLVAPSSTAHNDIRTERAPDPRKARAIPTTPSAMEVFPLALWQQLSTTSLALIPTWAMSFIVSKTSSFLGTPTTDLLGARAISPAGLSPWAAMCTKLTSWILLRTSSFVASSPIKQRTPTNLDTICASSLALGNGGRVSTLPFISEIQRPTAGSPTIKAPLWEW